MHARVQPERYQRQLRLFHEIVGFRKLGLVYEDSPSGRSYAAVDAVRQIAMEKGFSVRACDARASGVSAREATANVLHCYQELEGRVDAVRHREPGIDTGRRRSWARSCARRRFRASRCWAPRKCAPAC